MYKRQLVGVGSIAGAVLGVKLNCMIPLTTAKLFLYLVVLASGASILLKKDKPDAHTDSTTDNVSGSSVPVGSTSTKTVSSGSSYTGLLANKPFVLVFGFITGAICSLSGAGGPVLVMPILVTLGICLLYTSCRTVLW